MRCPVCREEMEITNKGLPRGNKWYCERDKITIVHEKKQTWVMDDE